MAKSNNWYVVTGGPSTGKTTLLAELEKIGHMTIPEAARAFIDEAMKSGRTLEEIRKDERQFQLEVLDYKVKLEQRLAKPMLTFLDRGLHDSIAYMRLFDYEIRHEVLDIMRSNTYKKVFLLEPLPAYKKDYARTETADQAMKLNELLEKAYEEFGMRPIRVPLLPPAERAHFVLQHLT